MLTVQKWFEVLAARLSERYFKKSGLAVLYVGLILSNRHYGVLVCVSVLTG